MERAYLNRIATAFRHCGGRLGVSNDIFLANNLISIHLFDEMPERDVVTWTTMVSGYTNCGKPDKAVGLYNRMLESESEMPNGFLYSAVLKPCGLLGDLRTGKLILERICGERLEFDTVLMNTLLDIKNTTTWCALVSGFTEAGLMEEAVSLFHQMKEPSVVSWNSIIAGFADNGSSRAFEFVCIMHGEGLKLDGFTFPCALGCNELTEAVELFDQHSLCYASCLRPKFAMRLPGMLGISNKKLMGYVTNERNSAALDLVLKIHCSGTCMDSYTFSGALKACVNLLHLRLGRQNHIVGSILIDMYARLGNNNNTLGLFQRLPKKDALAWSGCATTGRSWLAFSLFQDMVYLGLKVDQLVISFILKVCSRLTFLGSGKQESEEVVVTSLLDLYSKCGYSVEERDTVCWTGILVGCGLKPNEITYLGVLSACRHAGLVEELHYYCMVDILGHAGCVKEAEQLIAEMPFEPDPIIWRSLPGACGTHKYT
ncbi:pentatricopeptide repeat-containing protein [Pyrus ussuriensis x Pyrus communis]|uniref:Pentatricopeptide repeat-containing protein n=1 Tax=Pyrus ussuriensis x Pyrus communis TaxID=2448454 RepID=A0A5N5GNY2_9ROSA|nr:pentatricopeptide repeat-containing protein [Pyrus ussuriensis x Pyrus communis]